MGTVQHLPCPLEHPSVRTGSVDHATLLARKREAELDVNWASQGIWMAGGAASGEHHLHSTFPCQLCIQGLFLYVAT